MRQPRLKKVPKSERYPRGECWHGAIEYQGHNAWVGSFPTKRAWTEQAIEVVLPKLKERAAGNAPEPRRVPTVSEFAGVRVDPETGRVVPREGLVREQTWPWTHRRDLRKDSSFRRFAEALRPFIRGYGDRMLDDFTRAEAREIAQGLGQHTREAVRRLFGDALDDEVITGRNVFAGLGHKKGKRKDDPDFEIASEELVEKLRASALVSRADDYRHTTHAIVTWESCSGMRPSEIFGLNHDDIHLEDAYVEVFWQIDDRGKRTAVKNELRRIVPLFPEMRDTYLAAPRLSEELAFPAVRGGPMKLSQWHTHWHAIRAAAGRPDFEFYELKHRAITWMCTPRESGGLGLDPATVAEIVGHQDGGRTIAKYYLRLDQRAAAKRALTAAKLLAEGRHLRAVGD